MSRGMRQAKRIQERKNQEIAKRPEIAFAFSVLHLIYKARKEGDAEVLESVLRTVDDYVSRSLDNVG